MADLKTVLTETLRQHGELEDSGGTCECGWYVRGSDHAEHLSDVLIEAFGLTTEWAVLFTDGRVYSRPSAGEPTPHLLERVKTYWPGREIHIRAVTAWTAAAGVFSEGATND